MLNKHILDKRLLKYIDYIIVDKKDIINLILEKNGIFTPFINIDNKLQQSFAKLVNEKSDDGIYIEIPNVNADMFIKYDSNVALAIETAFRKISLNENDVLKMQ